MHKPFNSLIDNLPSAPTVALGDKIRELIRKGENIISLQGGDPDFNTPIEIVDGIYNALKSGQTHYSDSQGLLDLRRNIASEIQKNKILVYDPISEILVTSGGIHALYCTINAIFNQGDEIIVFTPAWPTHLNLPALFGLTVCVIETTIENNFIPFIEQVKEKINARTKGIIINYPNNPTGCVAPQEFIESLVSLAIEHNIYIISDDVYEKIISKDIKITYPAAISAQARKLTISINSFSKSHAMTGHRIGYVAASKEVISMVKKVSQYSITNVSTFIQQGISDALLLPQLDIKCDLMNKEYNTRNDRIESLLKSSKRSISFIKPCGAFYYFISLPEIPLNSLQLSELLLEKEKVAMVPGIAYGEAGENYLRMTFASSLEDIQEGLKRLIHFYNSY